MTTLLNDLKHGARLLLRAPGFTAVAVAALAIGIGANTAIFSVVNAVLLRPLPYSAPAELAMLWEHNITRNRTTNPVSPGNFIHWREMQQSFVDIAAVGGGSGNTLKTTITSAGDPEELVLQLVSASFFPLLGVQPVIGRTFTPEEDRPASRVAVISDRLWKRRFKGDRSVLNTPMIADGNAYTVVGVMPPSFFHLDKSVDVWMPMGFAAASRTPRGRWITGLGRLKPGVTFEQAQADMKRVHTELTSRFPAFNTGWTANVVPLEEQMTGAVRPALLMLLAAVAFVLLIACANVANLLLARATTRQRELAVRAALGAGRGRLMRQMMAESLLLAVAGAAAGLIIAAWAVRVLRVVAAEQVPVQRLDTVSIDGTVLAFTAAATLISAVFFGLIPALTSAGANLHETLKEGGRTGTASRGARTRSVFVVVQVAIALMLLVGAGLLVRSFTRLLAVDPGFDASQTVTMRIALPGSRYREPVNRAQFYQRLFERIDALPGLKSAGAISFLPLTGLGAATDFEIVGRPKPPLGESSVCDVRVIAHDYFAGMGMPLVKGRIFTRDGVEDAKNRIVINETMAKQFWPNEDPIGKRIVVGWFDPREDEIIGVVGDTRHASLETEPRATIFWPHPRFPYNVMALTLKATGDPQALVRGAVSAVRGIDPQLAVSDIRTMEEVLALSVAERRLVMVLLAIFAGAALLLASVGIYGVIAYSVTQRTQEIGIRMALGAAHRDVLRMIVGQALTMTLSGIALGAIGGLLVTRLMKGLLFDVKPSDPVTFITVAGILTAVSLLASYLPGRRATRVDPVIALRAE